MIGAMVCLLAVPWVQLSVSAGNGWPHNALWHHWLMPISCHFRDCKALLVTSLTHVSSAITSVQTFTFTFLLCVYSAVFQVDSIEFYSMEAERLKSLAEVERTVAVRQNIGVAFITFDDASVAARFHILLSLSPICAIR